MVRKGGLILLLLSALALAFPRTSDSFALKGVGKGDAVPDVAFAGITVDSANLSSFAGEKGLIVIYWDTRSARCPPILRFAEKELRRYEEYGMNLLAVNADGREIRSEEIAAVRAKVAELGVSFPVVLDAAWKGYDDLGIESVPVTLILDGNLSIVEAFAGFSPAAGAEIRNALDAFLGIGQRSGEQGSKRPSGAVPETGSVAGGEGKELPPELPLPLPLPLPSERS